MGLLCVLEWIDLNRGLCNVIKDKLKNILSTLKHALSSKGLRKELLTCPANFQTLSVYNYAGLAFIYRSGITIYYYSATAWIITYTDDTVSNVIVRSLLFDHPHITFYVYPFDTVDHAQLLQTSAYSQVTFRSQLQDVQPCFS